MAPQYKISYFDNRGLAETARLIFALKGIEYTDNRVAREAWPDQKKDTPWGSLPTLEFDGKTIAQSQAIELYLAGEYGLTGETSFEAAKCVELVGAMTDLRTALFKAFFESDEAKKAEALATIKKETFPFYLGKFSSILEKTGKYLVGNKLTHADLNIASFLNIFSESEHLVGLLSDYPLLKAHQETVFGTPGIKEWVANRPKTPF